MSANASGMLLNSLAGTDTGVSALLGSIPASAAELSMRAAADGTTLTAAAGAAAGESKPAIAPGW